MDSENVWKIIFYYFNSYLLQVFMSAYAPATLYLASPLREGERRSSGVVLTFKATQQEKNIE